MTVPDLRLTLKCPHCKTVIGRYTTDILYLGPVIVRRPLVATCSECSHQIRWRPTPIDSAKSPG